MLIVSGPAVVVHGHHVLSLGPIPGPVSCIIKSNQRESPMSLTVGYVHHLDTFDKILLAACAVRRAQDNVLDSRRFRDEYETAMAWKGHRVVQAVDSAGRPMSWLSRD